MDICNAAVLKDASIVFLLVGVLPLATIGIYQYLKVVLGPTYDAVKMSLNYERRVGRRNFPVGLLGVTKCWDQVQNNGYLIHGLTGSLNYWKQDIENISNTNTLLLIDLLGFGGSPKPNGDYMKQMAGNLTDEEDGFHLIRDRDTKYTREFQTMLEQEGSKPILCPVRAPNCDAFAERFVRSIEEECLSRVIFSVQKAHHRAITEFVLHYHTERKHQGVENQSLKPQIGVISANDPIHCRERLGAMLNYYYRKSA